MNKRMLSLTLALVMILGSLSTVFGLEKNHVLDTEKKAGEFLYDNDVLIGGDGGNLFLDQNLARRDSIVLLSRLLGEEDAAKNYKVGKYPTFTDVKKDSYYTPFAGWAQDNGYYKGGDDNKLYPMDHITARQYATVLLRALGYPEEDWNGVYELAEYLGLFEYLEVEKDDKITRGQMALMTVNALYTDLKDGSMTLAEKLEIEMPELPVEDFEVKSVKALNAKHIEVEFNKAVSSRTAKKPNNYVLTINYEKYGRDYDDMNEVVEDIKVAQAGKSVILELKDEKLLDNGDKYSVDVKTAVTSIDGENLIAYGDSQKVFRDDLAPEILKTNLVGNDLRIYYNEPVDTSHDDFGINIDGKVIDEDRIEAKIQYNTGETGIVSDIVYFLDINLEGMDDLLEKGEHKVTVYNVRDIVSRNGNGGNRVQLANTKYTVKQGVTEELKVESINPTYFNQLEVKFNRAPETGRVKVIKDGTVFADLEVNGALNTINLPYTVLSESSGLTPLYGENKDSSKVKVIVSDYQDEDKVVGKKVEKEITLKREAGKPVASYETAVVDVELTDKGTIKSGNPVIEIDLTRGSDTSKIEILNKNKVEVKDKFGITRTIENIELKDVVGDKQKLVITLANDEGTKQNFKELLPLEVSVEEKALIVDSDKIRVESPKTNKNDEDWKLDEYTNKLTNDKFEVKANLAPDVEEEDSNFKHIEAVKNVGINHDDVKNVITVEYSESMSPSAGKLSNYKLDGESLPKGTKISMDATSKVVTIILPEGSVAKDYNARLQISKDVKTALGEIVVGNIATKEGYMTEENLLIADNTAPEVKEAKFVVEDKDQKTSNTFLVEFNEKIKIDEDKYVFVPKNSSQKIKVESVELTKEGKGKVLKVVLEDTVNVGNGGKLVLVEGEKVGAISDMGDNLVAKEFEIAVSGKEVDKGATGTGETPEKPVEPTEPEETPTDPETPEVPGEDEEFAFTPENFEVVRDLAGVYIYRVNVLDMPEGVENLVVEKVNGSELKEEFEVEDNFVNLPSEDDLEVITIKYEFNGKLITQDVDVSQR